MSTRNFRIPETFDDWMRSVEKRILRQERRQTISPHGSVTGGGNPVTITGPEAWFLNTDSIIATGPGNTTMILSFVPMDGSEHVYFNSTWVPPTQWTRVGRVLTILDPDGDIFADNLLSCSYAYDPSLVVQEPPMTPPPDPTIIGSTTGIVNTTTLEDNFDLPVGTAAGDMLVIMARAGGAPGGGDIVDGFSCSDPRMTLKFSSTIHPMCVWVGQEDGSGLDVVVDIDDNPSLIPGAVSKLVSIRGVNAVTHVDSDEGGSTTPQVPNTAAVAVTWVGNASFILLSAPPPTGYTDIVNTGLGYTACDMSYWSDPDALISPVSTYAAQGVVVLGLV